MSTRLAKILPWLCAFIIMASCGEKQEEIVEEVVRPVKSMLVGRPVVGMAKVFPGKIEASQVADLAFQVSGRLIEFPILEGQMVQKGQLIAQLEPRDFEIVVNETRAKRDLAAVELNRSEQLLAREVASQSTVDKKRAALEISRAGLEAAERDLAYASLRAPFSGLIARKYVENFQNVKAKELIVRFQDIEHVDISLDLPESLVIDLGESQEPTMEVEFESVPGRFFTAKYKEHKSEADPATQTYNVILTMEAPEDLTVLPGMTVKVRTTLQTRDVSSAQFLIPASAVFADEKGQPFVWLVDPETHRVKAQSIKVGVLARDSIYVEKGLKQGARIVTAGVHFIRENMKIKPMASKSQSNRE